MASPRKGDAVSRKQFLLRKRTGVPSWREKRPGRVTGVWENAAFAPPCRSPAGEPGMRGALGGRSGHGDGAQPPAPRPGCGRGGAGRRPRPRVPGQVTTQERARRGAGWAGAGGGAERELGCVSGCRSAGHRCFQRGRLPPHSAWTAPPHSAPVPPLPFPRLSAAGTQAIVPRLPAGKAGWGLREPRLLAAPPA